MGKTAALQSMVTNPPGKGDWDTILQRIMTSYNDISKAINPKGLLKINLTSAQIKLLTCFSNKAELTMTELSNNLAVSMPTMTAMVDRLVNSKMVERERDNIDRRVVRERDNIDRRVVRVKLTDAGEKILKKLISIRRREMEKILMNLTGKEMESYLTSIEVVAQLLAKARQGRDMEG
ncbi:MAG: MarR family transcriptional regulator [Deltaproteobacteria bacterium]|nr:MarR family transcriptional regulator [Deltaproteobacteria bacterium]